ncbi:MAG: nucleotidyltransferase family protein, partial [Clostridia bacterium]|nr:nucleotidyltransferase family protein [Clostridia bacterium]
MNITGIVAEYNPYHNGHQYLTAKCREAGATHVVAVMSGNFVQRGSVAIMDKRARAKAALSDGVDLVLELPVPWAVSTA